MGVWVLVCVWVRTRNILQRRNQGCEVRNQWKDVEFGSSLSLLSFHPINDVDFGERIEPKHKIQEKRASRLPGQRGQLAAGAAGWLA